MSQPVRVQRQRTKGWKMPANTVYVGRPTAFGNPFEVERFGREAAIALYRNALEGYWNPQAVPVGTSAEIAYADHCELGRQFKRAGWKRVDALYAVRQSLRGKNLACWCPLDQPCHADVLLEIANAT